MFFDQLCAIINFNNNSILEKNLTPGTMISDKKKTYWQKSMIVINDRLTSLKTYCIRKLPCEEVERKGPGEFPSWLSG